MGISVYDDEHHRWLDVKGSQEEKDDLARRECEYATQRIIRGFSDFDVCNIDIWFLTLIPEMLQKYKENCHGAPWCLDGEKNEGKWEQCHGKWNEILDEMIFLFREAREETCSKKNPYDEEYFRAFDEFNRKYGLLGEKLQTEEERKKSEKTGLYTAYFMWELPEYQDINQKYSAEEDKLRQYREECRNKAMALFTRWLPYLWY